MDAQTGVSPPVIRNTRTSYLRFYYHQRTHHGYRTRGQAPASIVIGANER